jgi:hypothetical protein
MDLNRIQMGFAGLAPAASAAHRACGTLPFARGTGRHNVAVITKHAAFEFEVGPS